MEIQQLRYVVAVDDERHFGRAAERLHVAQQSVSEQIRRLERELGAPIFVRTSRRVALTSVGEAFLPAARRALRAIDEAADIARQVARGTGGQLRVGYAGELGHQLMRLTVPRLRQLTLPVQVQPEPKTTPEQMVALAEQRLDLAFGWTPKLDGGFAALLITRDPLVLAVAEDHPLATLSAVPPEKLSGWPLIIAPQAVNPRLYELTVSQLVSAGAVLTVHQEIEGLDRMLPLILAGTAVAVTCATTAAANRAAGVTYLSFTEPAPYVDNMLVWRADDNRPAVKSFVAVARDLRDTGFFLPPQSLC
jgi:DNA-binding transcriptional LysR family regulator